MKRVTQKMIARELGLSLIAVSKALRGHTDISEATRERVARTSRRMGYRPNRIARSLVHGRTHLIGLLLPSFTNRVSGGILDGVEMEASRQGMHVLPARWDRLHDSDDKNIEELLQYQPDGLIVWPRFTRWDTSIYAGLLRSGVRIVFLDEEVALPGACCIHADDAGGARDLVGRLVASGHSDILLVSSPVRASSYELRAKGYALALQEAGLWPAHRHVLEVNPLEPEEGVVAALSKSPEVTALFCILDRLALQLIPALEQAGIRVPDDCLVAGYGDALEFPELLRFPLPSVHQFPEKIGALAVQKVLEMIDGKPVGGVLLTPAQVVRAPPAGGRESRP